MSWLARPSPCPTRPKGVLGFEELSGEVYIKEIYSNSSPVPMTDLNQMPLAIQER